MLDEPLIGFWVPMAMLCLSGGFFLTDRKDVRRRLAAPTAALALAMIAGYGLSTRGSGIPETALLAVWLNLAVPVTLMAAGTLIATFSGPSPVGPLPPWLRPGGFVMAFAGLAWVGAMLLDVPPGSRAHGSGEALWGTWVVVFLSAAIIIAGMGAVFAAVLGEARHLETSVMLVLAGAAMAMLRWVQVEGSTDLAASGWLHIHWHWHTLAFGGLLGLAIAGMALILSVYIGEKRMPDPGVTAPLSEEEKVRVQAILTANLARARGDGGESE